MSCFWNSILRSIQEKEKEKLGCTNSSPDQLVQALKQVVAASIFKPTPLQVNDMPITEQQWREIVEAIGCITRERIFDGYDVSACEPVLCVLSVVLGWKITHNYAGHVIQYTPPTPQREVHFSSSQSHFN